VNATCNVCMGRL